MRRRGTGVDLDHAQLFPSRFELPGPSPVALEALHGGIVPHIVAAEVLTQRTSGESADGQRRMNFVSAAGFDCGKLEISA